jgi:F-type H+-transporting ATPase subunit b
VQSAVVHLQGSTVIFPASTENTVKVGEESKPGPIVPEVKELIWGAGAFVVFAVLMRFVLFPKVKRGMDARYASIQRAHENADQLRAAARAEIADYEAQVAGIRAEAARKVDAARQTVESERQARLVQVNARLNEQRATAVAEADQARQAARGQIHAAVSDVAGRAGELATGQRPDAGVVDRVVGEVMAR